MEVYPSLGRINITICRVISSNQFMTPYARNSKVYLRIKRGHMFGAYDHFMIVCNTLTFLPFDLSVSLETDKKGCCV